MSVIGIDFGNDTCVIGMAARGGIDIILNENSNRKNPTLVRYIRVEMGAGAPRRTLARASERSRAS